MDDRRSDQIRGRTIRFSWIDGPTKGTTHEHVFHEDGTVEWHAVDEAFERREGRAPHAPAASRKADRPRYYSVEVSDDFWLVSYLSSSGYTLTVVLNFDDGSMVGIASNDKNWIPVHGHFQVRA
jgi:hypothetical protein